MKLKSGPAPKRAGHQWLVLMQAVGFGMNERATSIGGVGEAFKMTCSGKSSTHWVHQWFILLGCSGFWLQWVLVAVGFGCSGFWYKQACERKWSGWRRPCSVSLLLAEGLPGSPLMHLYPSSWSKGPLVKGVQSTLIYEDVWKDMAQSDFR